MMHEAHIVRIAQEWDTPEHRLFCTRIRSIVAAASENSFIHRGRNTLVRLLATDTEVVVKLFPSKRGLKKLLQWSCKATRSYDHALRLVELGIGTPEPFATVRFPDGSRAYVCAWVGGCRQVWALHDHEIPEGDRIAADLGSFVGCMHIAGAMHRDNTPGNILLHPVDNRFEFLVVDTNRMRFGRVDMWAGLASLVQLECDDRLLEGYCWARSWTGTLPHRLFRFHQKVHRCMWWLKNCTRPLRRSLGF